MQPTYLPWLGYFDLIDSSDIFLFYDDVQFEKQSWQTRNRIKSPHGEILLSIPILNNPLCTLIKDIKIDTSKHWNKKHLKTIFYNYNKSKFFNEVYPYIDQLLNLEIQSLSEFNTNIIISICHKIGIKTDFILNSKLSYTEGEKDVRLVNICKKLGATTYLSPLGSFIYIEKQTLGGAFFKNELKLYYQNYKHPTYYQIYSDFKPYMCILDLLFNEGFDNALNIIRSGRQNFLTSSELPINEK